VKPGDRVLVYHGKHTQINVVPEIKITKVPDNVDPLEASLVIISTMGLGGVRKLEFEMGESAMVMGLGLLGMFAVQFLRLSGAYPLIAADLNPDRRALALELGADYALDPSAPDFVEQVKALTDGEGVDACVEVTGISAAMNQALQCSARQGRIALLGCTRVSDCAVDFYSQVHRPGIKLIGAHNMVRPMYESYPHHWTHQDDCKAVLKMLAAGRVKIRPVISRVVSPEQAPEIYDQLCNDPKFPMGTIFDWRDLK
jgi:threonine dehydrogenase-like Zn-dependent dehydrogenase